MNYTQEQKTKIKSATAAGRVAARIGKSKPKMASDLKRQTKATTALRVADKKIKKADREATKKRALANKLAREYKKAVANAKVAEHLQKVSQKQKKVAERRQRNAKARLTAKRAKINGFEAVKSSKRKSQVTSVVGATKKIVKLPVNLAKATLKTTGKVVNKTLNILDPTGYGKALKKEFNPFK